MCIRDRIDSFCVFRGWNILEFSMPMKQYLCLILIIFTGQIALAQSKTAPLEISLKNKDQREEQTKQQLERLLSTYDLSKWIFTRKILIESRVIPHSHPVLTLSTRHLKDDELLLATFFGRLRGSTAVMCSWRLWQKRAFSLF